MELLPGVEYTFIITATNAAGSDVIGTAKATPFTRPGVPGVGTTASVTSSRTAVISFTQGATNGNPITQYNYSTAGTAGPWTELVGTAIGTTPGPGSSTTVTATISPLGRGSFTFNLQAQNLAGAGLPGTNTYGPITMPYSINLIGTGTSLNGVLISIDPTITTTLSVIPINSTGLTGFVVVNTGINIRTQNTFYATVNKVSSFFNTSFIPTSLKLKQIALGKSNPNTVYYVAYSNTSSSIYKGIINGTNIPVGTYGASLTVASKSIALDSNDRLYISDNTGIYSLDSLGVITSLISGSTYNGLIAIDNSNNVYCLNSSNNIYKITPNGVSSLMTFTASRTLSTVTGFIHGALGVENSLLVADYQGGIYYVSEIPL